ncbi:MAG: hypothetical protein JKY44_08430 [Flavobacteriaceae bacterium]|nr:hypothetical protein [Flavobacteriaceae bacterium]
MKKVLKVLGIFVAILAIVIAIFYYKNNESLPIGVQGKEADNLATKMLTALNYDAYKNTESFEWSFRDNHHYKWNKSENKVTVSWDNNEVLLDTKNPSKSVIVKSEENSTAAALIKTATDYFNNDSFWLVAPFKVFDTGVERSIVKHQGKEALLVTYTSGGSTPGDSYLWILDDRGLPKSYKMWVDIIPIGGAEATWNTWTTTSTGVLLPTKHAIGLFGVELNMGDVKSSNPKADALAYKILKTIKHDAYKKTRYLEWSFRGRRSYKWDKQKNIVELSGIGNKIIIYPDNMIDSKILIKGKEGFEDKSRIINRGLATFNNDSFWLVAPHKLFEPGIIRSIVTIDDKEALKVKYTTGGTTPGDSYIWILNDDYLPIKYLMNVPSMKMNQVPATWEDWFVTESGTMLPKTHTFSSGRKLSMGDVKAYN